jgi:putative radical SAM enzyme (TIGR03279 family)
LVEIENILPGSSAAGLGLKKGDVLVSINNKDVDDCIGYRFLISDERIKLVVRRQSGTTKTFTLDKDPDDNLGIECAPFRMKRCRNRCIFCFVDQMPGTCRESLYIKDDDYRASFLYGNYITLGALSEPDWERIFSQRLSPLYISVHTTEPALRSFMLGNKKAPDIMESMKRLAAGGIRMHAQIVLCPGINDGFHLQKTLDDLAGLFPAVMSIAVVPVGLTAFRKKAFALRTFTRQEARVVIQSITEFGTRYKKRFGTRLAYSSDEFYIKAGAPIPTASFYEDFPQIENGVGMVADFLRDVSRTKLPKRSAPIKATVISGVSFGKILGNILARLRSIAGIRIRHVTVVNKFFGPSVTVTGLLTGRDIFRALQGKRLGDLVLVPAVALKNDEDVFLDNMSLAQLSRKLSIKVVKVENYRQMLAVLRSEGRQRP